MEKGKSENTLISPCTLLVVANLTAVGKETEGKHAQKYRWRQKDRQRGKEVWWGG